MSYLLPQSAGGWLIIFSILSLVLSIGAIVHLLRNRKDPMTMLSWLLGVLLFPLVGAALYALFGERRVRRRARKKRRRLEYISKAIAFTDREATERSAVRLPDLASHPFFDEPTKELATICARLGRFPLTAGNGVRAFTCAQDVYRDMIEAIEAAEDHIHLEYYIFRPDETGRLFRDLLIERARKGIEVRLLIDGVGSFWTAHGFLRPLEKAGGKVAVFLPAVPFRRPGHINCRNHRKIAVVDGKIAYTGSQNIGDEHRGLLWPRGPWKETHFRIEGPAALHLQDIFIEDWYFSSGEDLASRRYLRRQPARGESIVQVVESGPDQEEPVLAHIFISALSLARKSIRITTPYFVPDPALILALQNAAYRGLAVEVMVPSVTDNRLVLWAGRSFYQELLRAGVRIFEYDHGMLHSKTVIIDDRWSLVGSANMDTRSFILNFEVTASIFDVGIARQLQEDFCLDRARSREIAKVAGGSGRLVPSLMEGAARLFAPLL